MCVAVIVETKENISSENLKAMHDANDDGGGVAWVAGNHVRYKKGLTWQQIDVLQGELPRPFFMHFRIATKGGIRPELTHPFPIGINAFSSDLEGTARSVLMHNGTWHNWYKYVPKFVDSSLVSDTQVAAYAAFWDEDILDDVKWSNAVMKLAGKDRAHIQLRGQWSVHEGNRYSNLHWQPRATAYDYGWTESDFEEWLDWRKRKVTPAKGVYTPATSYGGEVSRPYGGGYYYGQSRYNQSSQPTYQTQYARNGAGMVGDGVSDGVVEGDSYAPDSGPVAKPEKFETEFERRSRLKREKIIRSEEKRNRRNAKKRSRKDTAPIPLPPPTVGDALELLNGELNDHFATDRDAGIEIIELDGYLIPAMKDASGNLVPAVLNGDGVYVPDPDFGMDLELDGKVSSKLEDPIGFDDAPTLELEPVKPGVDVDEGAIIELEDLGDFGRAHACDIEDFGRADTKPALLAQYTAGYAEVEEEIQAQIKADGIKIVSEP